VAECAGAQGGRDAASGASAAGVLRGWRARRAASRRAGVRRRCKAGDAPRDSYASSPSWTKSLVSGLTDLVNGVMGGEEAPDEPRARRRESVTPEELLEGIREDFEERQYLWSGDIDPELYDEACTFTDPTLSFRGLGAFERNIRNLRPILDAVVPDERRRCILRGLEREAGPRGRVLAEWTMVGDVSLPWGPRIRLSGRTAYTPGRDGRIVSYDEQWDISAGEALLQLLRPAPGPDAAQHWPGRLDGVPPPAPGVQLDDPPPFVMLPGFGNDAVDYVEPLGQDPSVGLLACLRRRGVSMAVSEVRRIDWLKVFWVGLQDEDFRAGNGTAPVAFGWYLDAAKGLIEETVRAGGGQRAVLLGHSAGGWLARALMQREGRGWVEAHVRGLVTLGSPHLPPPPGVMDMTQGCLRNLDASQPGAYFADCMFYATIAGAAVRGRKREGNVPILELVESPSQESTAYNSYSVVCGDGTVTGDGIVPLAAAHLRGAEQLTLDGCLHSINVAGTTRPTDRSYLCEAFVDDWLRIVEKCLRQ